MCCAVLVLRRMIGLLAAACVAGAPIAATAQSFTALTSGVEFLATYDAGDATDRENLLVLLAGELDGLMTANSLLVLRRQERLFCLTDNARITGKTALDLMRQQVTDAPSHGALPWGSLLAGSLIYDFPCAPS